MKPTPAKRFRAALVGRTLPLLALVVSITALGAPVAFYAVSTNELKRQGEVFAHDLAATLSVEAQARPRLWRYDSSKILEHLRAFRLHDQLLEIRVYDTGRLIAERRASTASASLWTHAAIGSSGSVWVAMSLDRARSTALRLLVPFLFLGLFLSWLLFVLPRRALSHAERETDDAFRQLRESQQALSELNESLEGKVETQVEQLRDAYEELQRKEGDLRRIAAKATSLEVEERQAIGRDLHDAAGQVLTAIRLNLQRLENKRDDPGKVEELTQLTLKQVDGVMEEIRRTLSALGPAVVGELGLRGALKRHCEDVASWAPFELESVLPDSPELPRVPVAVETACYRIAQESLTNVARHAGASFVKVTLHGEGAELCLRVADDGSGMAKGESEPRGMGLRSMRERTELLGGRFEIESSPSGTTVSAYFPLGWGEPPQEPNEE